MAKVEIYQVDAFTNKPFQGNPAAVCITKEALDEQTMQAIAMEMNLSETAFATPMQQEESCNQFHLRWFTPSQEVSLCGHATLATSKVLFDIHQLASAEIRFHTKSGELIVTRESEASFCLNFPVDLTEPVAIPDGLAVVLGIENIEDCVLSHNMKKLLLRVASKEQVTTARPNFADLAQWEQTYGNRGFIVTSRDESGEFDFVSRYFAPGVGIDEDPVTGAAHTVLGPYWGRILGKDCMRACQASSRRGIVGIKLVDDRIHLIGEAVLTLSGTLQF